MIERLVRVAMQFRRNGWFARGERYPMPFGWQGWAVLGGWIVAVAATVVVPGEDRPPVLFVLAAALAGIVYWTYDDR